MSIVLVVAPQVGQARDPQVSSIIASPSPFPIPVRFPLPVWRTGVDECERHGNPVPRKDPNENVHHRQREQHQRVRHPRGGRRRHGNPVRFLRQPAGVGGSGRPLARREAPGRVEQPAGRDGGQEVQGPEHGHQPDLGAHPGTRRAGGPEGRRPRGHARAEGGPTRQAEGGTEGQRRRTGSQEDDRPNNAPKGKKVVKAKDAAAPREGSKTAQVVAMLQRKGGATLAEVMKKMGWQKHTVRGFMAGAMKKAGYQVESFKPEGGERTYRINK